MSKYLPKHLTSKDRRTQRKNLNKSRKLYKKEKDDENEKNNKNPKNIDIDWGLHIKGTTPLDKINNSYPNCYTIKELSPNNTYKHSDVITYQKPSKFDNISISSRNLPYFKNILDHDLRKEVNIDE